MFEYTTRPEDARDGYDLIPVGDYDATIIKSEEGISKATGSNQVKLELDTGRGHLWCYLSAANPNLGKLVGSILQSAGIFAPGMQVKSTTFRGLKVRVRVKHEMYNGAMSAKIDKFLSRGGNSSPVPQQSQPAGSAAADEIPF